MLGNRREYLKMQSVQINHWWYRTLHHRLLYAIRAQFGFRSDLYVLDAGCGTGGNMLALRKAGFHRIVGFDLSADAVALCRANGLDVYQADLRNGTDRFASSSFDVILCTDVLYFLSLEEIPAVLEAFCSLLGANGILIVNVPALNAFRGNHDLAVGIEYRFDKRILRELFNRSPFEAVSAVYWPVFLAPVILAARMLQRFGRSQREDTKAVSDLQEYPAFVNKLLFAVNRIEHRLLGKTSVFGSSLFAVAGRDR